MTKRQTWTKQEIALIHLAVFHVMVDGKSIYSEVQHLHKGTLSHRTFSSIRNKLNRERANG